MTSKIHITNYSPFGVHLQNRNFTGEGYRYGFNGQEKDDEVAGAGNSYTAEFWQYNPCIVKRWNIDPVVKLWLSGYSTFRNNPIIFTDPNGDDDVFTNSKTGKTTIIKTKDKFDRNFVDGKQQGENLEQGWGINTYGKDSRIVDLDEKWNREYLYDDDRIVGLAAFKSGQDWMDDGEVDKETPAVSFHFGVVDLGGGFENSGFYQTFYSDFNPSEEPGYRLDGNSRGKYPDKRVPGSGSAVSDEKDLFDLYMFDEPQRVHFPSEKWKNMKWKGNTSFLYKSNSGQIKSLITLKWGFEVKGFIVTRDNAEKTDSPSQFHIDNMPASGSLDPNVR